MNGTITHNALLIGFTGDAGWSNVGNKFYVPIKNNDVSIAEKFQATTGFPEMKCNMYPFDRIDSNGSAGVTKDKHFYLQRTSNLDWCRVWVYDTAYTLEGFKALLNSTRLLVTVPIPPETYALTGDMVKTLAGQNVFWTDSNGPMEIEYWKV